MSEIELPPTPPAPLEPLWERVSAFAEGADMEAVLWLVNQAVVNERERCARVCDARVIGDHNREDEEAKRCAEAIRKGTA